MRISFDLDETLFVSPKKSAIEEPQRSFWKGRYKERLRKGFVELYHELKEEHEIWIYTTSYRSHGYIKRYFKRYGITFEGVINGKTHYDRVQKGKDKPQPSKFPSQFGIDLHIDNDKSVKMNGDALGFIVLILDESDDDWVEKVRQFVQANRRRVQRMR